MDGSALILFFSKTGNTRIMVREIARRFSCDAEEIISRKKRTGLWTVNNVFDMLLDREDDAEPLRHDIAAFNPLVFASPVWIHKICSPVATVIKHADLTGKDLYVFLSHSGNYFREDGQAIRRSITATGANLRGLYAVLTRPEGEWHPRFALGAILKGIHTTLTSDNPPTKISRDTAALLETIDF